MSARPARVLLACALALACGAGPRVLRSAGDTMGTTFDVAVARPGALSQARLDAEVAAVLARVDARMSTWRDDSELSRFNRQTSGDWFPVSEETARVAAAALELSERSGGAFDPTVGPLVELWGFGARPASAVPPEDALVAATRERVGWRRLQVRRAPPALRKARADLELDLSGVAKGHAVDALAERLATLGCRDFLVDVGGEVLARGRNAAGRRWRVAIEQPRLAAGHVQRVVPLADAALATSGSYRSFLARGTRRWSHVVDPRSGRPAGHALVSVSVIADSALVADGLATALMVLGPEEGRALAEREGLAVLFLVAGVEGLVEQSTPAFERHAREG